MKYTEVEFTLKPVDPCRDLLVDALGNEGPYDSFVETPSGLKAYVPSSQFDTAWLEQQVEGLRDMASIEYGWQEMPDKNWNEEWEKQHEPVLVASDGGRRVWVRAPFHPHMAEADVEIEIEPKMSFGTAHHPTTYLMLSYLADMPLEGMRVLDMGCGTAVLGILACKRGAAYVEGIDIDEWAYNNALKNAECNGAQLTIHIGDATLLEGRNDSQRFDVVIANINRNILLHDMGHYVGVMKDGASLLLSGFYHSDVPALESHAQTLGLGLVEKKTRQDWCALHFVLKSNLQPTALRPEGDSEVVK